MNLLGFERIIWLSMHHVDISYREIIEKFLIEDIFQTSYCKYIPSHVLYKCKSVSR